MPISPCIADTDCIKLVIDDDGNLTAVPIIDPDPLNGLECRASGLYAPGNQWGIGCSSYDDVTAEDLIPFFGTVNMRTGTYNITNPSATNSALVWRFENFGTTQITDATPGSYTTVTSESRVLPAAYSGGQYIVWNNPGFTNTIAFPAMNGGLISCPFLLGPGVTQTVEWRQQAHVVTGVATITCRTAFFYVAMVVLPS